MLVAIVALVAALTGSAVALQGKNSVKSNDIAPNAVRGKDIASDAVKTRHLRDGKVTAPKLDLFKTGAVADEVSTTSAPAVDLGGPSVTVTVPTDGLVGIFARVEGRAIGGGPGRDELPGRRRLRCPADHPRIGRDRRGRLRASRRPDHRRPAAGDLHVLAPLQRRGRRHGAVPQSGDLGGRSELIPR
jgi:hypothetical protein